MIARNVIDYLVANAEAHRIAELTDVLKTPLRKRLAPLKNELMSASAAGFVVCLIVMTNAGWSKPAVIGASLIAAVLGVVGYLNFIANASMGFNERRELNDLTEHATAADLRQLKLACASLDAETHIQLIEAIGTPPTRFRVLYAAEALHESEDTK